MIERMRPHQFGIMLAAGGMLLISFDSLGIRLTEASSWDIAFWIGAFTTVAMFVLVPVRTGKSLPVVARADGLPMLASGLLQAASTTFFIIAINLTTVANTVVIVAASPVVAALIAHFAIGERTSIRTWAAIAASIGGILIVVSGSIGAGRIEGDLFAVGAILAFASNLTLWRRFPDLNRQVAIGLGGLIMALVAFVPADPFAVDAKAFLVLVVLGAVTGPAGRIAVATSTRYLPAAQVSLFAPVETVAAIGWAWLFLSETPPQSTIVGGAIIVGAIILGTTGRQATKPAPVEA
jgi:drug/metabolite transporter (DMT)-like permease